MINCGVCDFLTSGESLCILAQGLHNNRLIDIHTKYDNLIL
jgi:hypothetical protein